MTIYIHNHSFHYEMENLVRLFFPNDKIQILYHIHKDAEKPYILTSLTNCAKTNTGIVSVTVVSENFSDTKSECFDKNHKEYEKTAERRMAVCLYELLSEMTGITQPWGILTGVRPIKLFRRLAEKSGVEYAKDYFEQELLVSPEKAELSAVTESYEKKILSLSRRDSFSLYISIPFCPTRCSYCSFVSQTIEKAKKLIEPYFEFLCQEIAYTGEIVKACNLRLESVYIGGGTPTTLGAEQLAKLIEVIQRNFNMSTCREFTIEAGRPDTITEEKLLAIFNGGVDRISINPQTFNDHVLEVIGRKHTSVQTIEAFELARKIGFGHINMDLIAGLPADTPASFANTLNQICELSPESVTIHTLALKRSSRMTLEGQGVTINGASYAAQMLEYSEKKLKENAYHPYYLYRQSRMEGNLENTGWSKEGFDGLYNVFVMDETHTIIGCGAGAVTKLKKPDSEELERIFNYKYPYEYNNGFEEMLSRKEQVKRFYDELS